MLVSQRLKPPSLVLERMERLLFPILRWRDGKAGYVLDHFRLQFDLQQPWLDQRNFDVTLRRESHLFEPAAHEPDFRFEVLLPCIPIRFDLKASRIHGALLGLFFYPPRRRVQGL